MAKALTSRAPRARVLCKSLCVFVDSRIAALTILAILRLVPQPSNNVHDPLNWSLSWKLITAGSQLLYVWVLVSSALSLAPLFPYLGQEFRLDQQQLSLLTGLNVITLGFANILLVPISNIFGRRATSIVAGIFCILTNVWEALATSHRSLLAARACNGIVAATSETIMVQTIADMFFLHERGFWMGTYFIFYFSGAFLGPIMAGSIGQVCGDLSTAFLTHRQSTDGDMTLGTRLAIVLLVVDRPLRRCDHPSRGILSGDQVAPRCR